MDKSDLETYQVQLSQVELALSADPENNELISLRSELKELIELTQAAIAQAEAAASSKAESSKKSAAATASSSKVWSAGDDCLAKYSGDGQWYQARIASVGGSAENRVFSIVFKGYNNTELVNAAQIKALPANYQGPTPAAANKRKLSKAEEEDREKKKKKNEKKLEVKAAKAKEQQEKQHSWQKFAKKSEKKGIHIAGVAGSSIFKTPENPLGRVGVTGSGKGMTGVAPRTKHKFEVTDEPNA
ncbi:Survival of motor neuron-related-splicing factor 30 [Trametes pubescens]|uniref:Survival of motor neuron-related-splicing factor 30 n=1 Tax=Trametes pubescens TaxID=154538 RepID=A0A1M2V6E1_TRAPU|nr:Survival of motor neuron-related-splicing factor 30 [Trametes pubescens]